MSPTIDSLASASRDYREVESLVSGLNRVLLSVLVVAGLFVWVAFGAFLMGAFS